MSTITITNHGQWITHTDYWQSPIEAAGKLYLSPNAGAIRILIPRAHRAIIQEMRRAKYAVLSRGPWPEMRLPDAVEIMWEDGSDAPFALHLSPESCSALPSEPPKNQEWIISAWDYKKGRPHKCVERICHWRRVDHIPCLTPWVGAP